MVWIQTAQGTMGRGAYPRPAARSSTVREVPESKPARPNRFPDAGGYPDERDRRAKSPREIDCSVAHAERTSPPKSTHGARAHRVRTDEPGPDR